MQKITLFIFTMFMFFHFEFYAQNVSTIEGLSGYVNDALAVDEEGNIYGSFFTNSANGGKIYKMNINGDISVFSEGFDSCNGLDFDSDGNLYVVDFKSGTNNHQIYRLDEEGNKQEYGPTIFGASNILFSPTSDTLYVAQYYGNKITKLAPDGNAFVFCEIDEFDGPVGMAFDDNGRLYVANFNDGKIFRISADGQEGEMIADIPNVSYWGIGFMTYASGYLYATGIGKHIIYQVSLDGDVIEYAGTGNAGSADGPAYEAEFNRPNGIVSNIAQDTLYISDMTFKSIRIISQMTTSVTEMDPDVQILDVYPNPAGDLVNIHFELLKNSIISLSVLGMDGKVLEEVLLGEKASGESSVQLKLPDLPAGVYVIRIKTKNKAIYQKLVIE